MRNKALEAALGDDFSFMERRPGYRTTTYQHWGCECGDGWYQLIHDLCGEIAAAYSRAGKEPDIIVKQVKQKFAKLRFYYSFEGASDGLVIDFLGSGTLYFAPEQDGLPDEVKALRSEIKKIVRKYQEKSGTVCELCGGEGSLRKLPRNYYKTLCDKCFSDTLEKRKRTAGAVERRSLLPK